MLARSLRDMSELVLKLVPIEHGEINDLSHSLYILDYIKLFFSL